MAISEQRLALFAMLSEFEADARDLIGSHVCSDHSIEQDIGSEAYSILLDRATRAYSADELSETVLLPYLDIGDAIKILAANRLLLSPQTSASISKLVGQLQLLPAIRNRVMHRRPLEFDDLPLATDVLRNLTKGDKKNFPRTATALIAVASGKIFSEYSQQFSFDSPPSTLNNLPQADFDDTGFMGRREKIDELRKAINGPFPVITVLGVGGAGKSALALHVAYDVLNDPASTFDAVIWTSAKTSRLTGADVEDIVGAISSSVGIAEAALSELGETPGEDPFETVKELLGHFKILLFIDNLETILDERMRAFVRDIPSGSKIVFTSRIGLGAYDFVVPVKNLDPKPAQAFFRRVAGVWKQTDFTNMTNDDIASHCVRLNHSPLGIKWFIQAVAAGASPQRLLSNPQALLEFCLENIIDKLSEEAKSLLNVLAITGREQSPASMHYIADIDTMSIEEALRELIASNLITVIVSKFGEEDRYKISSLAQTYISRLHPPSAVTQGEVRRKQAQLTAMSERAETEGDHDFVFDPAFLLIRKDFSGTDAVAATYLRRALTLSRTAGWDAAFSEVEKAKQIAPSYFEVLRVEAQIAAHAGNTLRAQASFEEAMALKPSYPPLTNWYASFLVKALDDGAGAEKALRAVQLLHPGIAETQMELARCLIYQHKFAESWTVLLEVDKDRLKNSRAWRIYYDLLVQACTRRAEKSLKKGSADEFAESLAMLGRVVVEIPDHALDPQVEKHLRYGVTLGRRFLIQEGTSPFADGVAQAVDKISALLRIPPIPRSTTELAPTRLGGRITFLPAGKPFGFIDGDDGRRLFFHRNNLITKDEFDDLREGMVVGYSIGSNAQGLCADDVAVVS